MLYSFTLDRPLADALLVVRHRSSGATSRVVVDDSAPVDPLPSSLPAMGKRPQWRFDEFALGPLESGAHTVSLQEVVPLVPPEAVVVVESAGRK